MGFVVRPFATFDPEDAGVGSYRRATALEREGGEGTDAPALLVALDAGGEHVDD